MPEPAIRRNHIAVDGDTAAGQQDPALTRTPKMAVVLRAIRRCAASRAFRWGFIAVTVALGSYAIAAQWGQVSRSIDRMGLLTVALALVSVLLGLLMSMQAWRALLAGLGSPLPVPGAARIVFLGQLGKYLPGSVWPVLAQMELGTTHRVPRHRSASASVLFMLVALLTGLLTALVMLPFTRTSSSYLWALVATPVLVACLHPRVLNKLMTRLLRLARQPPLEHPLSGRALAVALSWWFAAWICFGVQIWLLTIRLGAPIGSSLLLAIGGYAFAWSVGFIVVFVPAGVGLRDVLLVTTLSPVVGVGGATAVALLSRALTTAGDLLTAASAGAWRPRPRTAAYRADESAPSPEQDHEPEQDHAPEQNQAERL
jgi:glycosyltransferase 2 family protein